MNIRTYNPAEGQAFQGDVSIIPIPADIAIATTEEISPVKGRLILQEGKVSGHHHAVDLRQRNFRKALGGMTKEKPGIARMYRDDKAVAEMVRRGILTRADLAIGCLVVEGGPMSVTHEEHDGISLPPGQYLIGRQVESAGAEERIVAD